MRNLIEELEVFESRRLEEGLVTSVDMVLSGVRVNSLSDIYKNMGDDKQMVAWARDVYSDLVNRLTDKMGDDYWDAMDLVKNASKQSDPEKAKKMIVDAAKLMNTKRPRGM